MSKESFESLETKKAIKLMEWVLFYQRLFDKETLQQVGNKKCYQDQKILTSLGEKTKKDEQIGKQTCQNTWKTLELMGRSNQSINLGPNIKQS
jgi:hypothetical protein